jgi:hypothetical protein
LNLKEEIMSIPTIAIFPAEAPFNPVQEYYVTFPHEVSETKDVHAMNIIQQVRLPHLTFELLLDTLTELRTNTPSIDTFLIVLHGLHDTDDTALGLAIPLASDTTVATYADILKQLLVFLDGSSSEDAMASFEMNTRLVSARGTPITLPPGLVSRLVGKMRSLQRLRVRKVEFRACTLGNQPDVMEAVGRSFGALWIYAPDVHMFYVRIDPGRIVTDAALTQFLQNRHDARPFSSGTDRLAIAVQGAGVRRIATSMTVSSDLHWFTDSMIWPMNSYPQGTSRPAPFVIAGMDVGLPLRFALPLDPDYSRHLIIRGPLKGNQI